MRKIYAAGTGALALLLTMTAAPASVRADSIYNNFGPAESFNEDYGYQIQAESFGFSTLAAAAFTPRGNFTLSEIDIGLAWSAHRSNAARIKLVNSVDGLPGSTVLESWSTAPAPCLQGPCGPQSLMSPGDVMLVSGTQYWVVAEPGNNGFDIWDWNNTGAAVSLRRAVTMGALGSRVPDSLQPSTCSARSTRHPLRRRPNPPAFC